MCHYDSYQHMQRLALKCDFIQYIMFPLITSGISDISESEYLKPTMQGLNIILHIQDFQCRYTKKMAHVMD